MDFSRFDRAQLLYFYKLLLSRCDSVQHSLKVEKARHYDLRSDKAIDLQAELAVIHGLEDLLLKEIAIRNVDL